MKRQEECTEVHGEGGVWKLSVSFSIGAVRSGAWLVR